MLHDTDPAPLIPPEDLRTLLGTPGLLLVDCRYELGNAAFGRDAYTAGHLPGAVFAPMEYDLSARRTPRTGRHPLPEPRDFAATLGRWGYTEQSRVVVYDQGSGAYAARLWWMLRARGHRRVQVLDGGFAAWVASGGVTVTAEPVIAPTVVQPRVFEGVLEGDAVAAAIASGSITLVDARAADRFAGRNESIDPVAGHVPGAVNHPFTLNLGPDQRWLAPQVLRERWQPVLQQAGGRPLVMMCGSGVTAAHNQLALEAAGIGMTQLYVGSWSDWITDPARPVATGEQA